VIDFNLSEDQTALRDAVGRLADDVYRAHAIEWDTNSTPLPHSERKRLAQLGYLGMALPEEFGGGGSELIDALIVIEELAKRSQIAAFQVFEACTGAARVIDLFGSAEAKARFLPPIAAGDKTMAVAISEPDAGSAATDMTTAAQLDDDGYVLNGVKRWCSGAGHAEQYLVYVRLSEARGSKGIGAVVVEAEAPGLSFGPQEKLLGFHGIPSADMFFDNVRVARENLIIEAGGFAKLFTAFSIERLGNSTMCLAIGQTCLDRTARYVQERKQFGRPIIEFQMVQSALAEMVMQVEASRLLTYRAAARAGRGAPVTLEASIAKAFANDMAKRVSDLALQLHGGYGYSVEYEIERLHRDAHGWALGGGTANIQRLRIAAEYLSRRFDQRG
jgi:alkylation response protein AidB-like acyl-CoA dehydrogenase